MNRAAGRNGENFNKTAGTAMRCLPCPDGPHSTRLFRQQFFDMNPFSMMRRMNEEIERFFSGHAAGAGSGHWSPAIEVKEEGGKLKITADLPGIKEEDIKVQVTDESITLESERRQQKEEKRE